MLRDPAHLRGGSEGAVEPDDVVPSEFGEGARRARTLKIIGRSEEPVSQDRGAGRDQCRLARAEQPDRYVRLAVCEIEGPTRREELDPQRGVTIEEDG